MFYTYVLQSLKDQQWYTGATGNLGRRLEEHSHGRVEATRGREPFKVIYYEACLDQHDAFRREQYLKSSWGKRYLKSRLKQYLTSLVR
ncbi:MAG: GIY-YIG nuclease family protein [Candidatus Omnitrophica bacterium]|nr:GIY-YIG nuclease family protein [Candidatus Omnitrophota bacterium]